MSAQPPRDLSRIALGRWGENRAATEYRRLGYEVIDRNWRHRLGEIDLILRRRDLIVFCEVKTRRSDRYGVPALAVDASKRLRLRRLAAAWLAEQQVRRVDLGLGARFDIRFDVVAITGTRLTRYESAF